MTNPVTENDLVVTEAARIAWEVPETVEIDLGQAKAANLNSNFDGTNFSS